MDPKMVNSKRRPLRQAIKECELRWFHETAALAQEGEAQQMVLLGHMYTVGYGCKPNPDEASKWFDEASKLLGYNVRSDPAPIMSSVGPPGLLQQQQPDQHRHHHHHHHHHHHSSHHQHSSSNQTHEQQQQQQQPAPHAPQLQHLSSYGLSPSSSRAAAAAAGGGSSSHQQQQLFPGSMPPHPAVLSPAAAAAAAAAGASVGAG